jgi:Zn-dependent protease
MNESMPDDPNPPLGTIFLPEEGVAVETNRPAGSCDPPATITPPESAIVQVRPPRRWPAVVLFLATCASTFYAGFGQFPGGNPIIDPATGEPRLIRIIDSATQRVVAVRVLQEYDRQKTLFNALIYAVAVMGTLAAHEAGHYLQARRYGVPASLPMFIPMPVGELGTLGAVIFQEPGVANRKSLFDIAISGPLAGLVVALPLCWWGIKHAEITPIEPGSIGFSNPRIVEWMVGWIHRPLQPGEDFSINPIYFAGWVGIFVTGLNLTPIGQLDGGHLLYCLIGKRAHLIARVLYFGAVAIVVYQLTQRHWEYIAWTLMLILVWTMGTRHPPTADDKVPLGTPRIVLGWLTLAFILVGFVATPKYVSRVPARTPVPIQEAPSE